MQFNSTYAAAQAVNRDDENFLEKITGYNDSVLRRSTCEYGSLLIRAASIGSIKCLKFLLNQEFTFVDVADRDGNNALFYAVKNGHYECARLLVAAGTKGLSKAREVTTDDETVKLLHYALYGRRPFREEVGLKVPQLMPKVSSGELEIS